MDSPRTVGIILIVGFVVMVVGAFVAPQGAYQGEVSDRLALIEDQESRWVLSKVFDGLSVLLLTGGMVLLGVMNTSNDAEGWLNTSAAVCFAIAGIVGVIWVYLLVSDPGPLYDRDTPAPLVVGFVALLAIGLFAYGAHFLQASGYPTWVAWVNIIVGVLVLIAVIGVAVGGGPPEVAFPLAAIIYAAVLTTGISLLNSS